MAGLTTDGCDSHGGELCSAESVELELDTKALLLLSWVFAVAVVFDACAAAA